LWTAHPYSLIYLGGVASSFFGLIYFLRSFQIPISRYFFWICLGTAIWNLNLALELLFLPEPGLSAFLFFGHAGRQVFIIGFVLAVLVYTHNDRFSTNTFWSFLFLGPIFLLIGFLTDPWLGGFLDSSLKLQDSLGFFFQHKSGWLAFLVETGIGLVWTGLCIFLLADATRFTKGNAKNQIFHLMFAILVFWTLELSHEIGLELVYGFYLTPLYVSGTVAYGIVSGAYSKYLNLIPLARNTIVDELDDPFVILDTKNKVMDWNLAASKFLQIPKGKKAGFGLADYAENIGILDRIADLPSKRSEMKWVYSDAEKTWRVSFKKIRSENFLHIGSILVFHDITTETKNSRDLEEINKNLSISNMTKDRFFSVLSHDLRGPLSGIGTLIQSISTKDLDSEGKQITKILLDGVNGLSNLLENIIQWAKLQKGHMEYDPKPTSINQIVKDTLELYKIAAEQKQIQLIDAIQFPVLSLCDEKMIQSILRNLISNGIKFTPANGWVKIEVEAKNKEWEISVKDNGAGMSPAFQNQLFKVDRIISQIEIGKESGHGLGLILCQEFIHKNNGKITVESLLGQGTTFRFTLPRT